MKTMFLKLCMASIAAILMVTLTSCPKHPINGDLDGQWQVMEVTPEPEEIIIPERLYYCFSLHTTQLTYYGSGPWIAGNILQFDKNLLVLDFPYGTTPLSVARLKQYGIYSNPVTFRIERLDRKQLILRDGDVVVTLRKF